MSLSNLLAPERRRLAARRPQSRRLLVEPLEDRCCLSVSVVATGLDNPRGLTFGPDGNIYVAEGGRAINALPPIASAQQVPFPVGPYTGGYNSRISRIDPLTGARATVVGGLPSSQTTPDLGSLVSGVSDVKFIGDTLYALGAGAGRSHALPLIPGDPVHSDNTLFRVNPDGSVSLVADLSTFVQNNPVSSPEPDDFEPDGTWYSMVAVRGALYAVEPNHGELDKITPDGQIRRVSDVSASQGHVVPTALAYHGDFYLGNLGTFPVTPGSEHIYKITPSGQIQVATSGLTTVLGVAFDAQGRMYALESDTVAGFPGPDAAFSGTVVRVNGDGSLTTLATGLMFPTAMTCGPDGNLYVSNFGFGLPPGAGQIVRIDLPPPGTGAGVVSTTAVLGGTVASSGTVSTTPAASPPGGGTNGSPSLGPTSVVTTSPTDLAIILPSVSGTQSLPEFDDPFGNVAVPDFPW
jgi:hypothetical protein